MFEYMIILDLSNANKAEVREAIGKVIPIARVTMKKINHPSVYLIPAKTLIMGSASIAIAIIKGDNAVHITRIVEFTVSKNNCLFSDKI